MNKNRFNIYEQCPSLIAGPCSAESHEQLMTTAIKLKEQGCEWFRAGIWKPRTRPGGFEGIGLPALEWLKDVRKKTHMKIGCEVANHEQCTIALASNIDFIWIGARTTSDPFAVQDIADCLRLSNKTYDDLTVIIKNPSSIDYDLWLGAIERIYNAGIKKIIACFRGFKTYNDSKYRNEPIWDILLRLQNEHPEIPIIIDPSHIAGVRELIPEIIQMSKFEYGFDNFMIESHYDPSIALTDASQQLTPQAMFELLNSFDHISNSYYTHSNDEDDLNTYRKEIDKIDIKLIDLLCDRIDICKKIGKYKKDHNIVIYDSKRWNTLLSNLLKYVDTKTNNDKQLNHLVNIIWNEIHSTSIEEQKH